jgi:peptidoglycan/xylan/chitin deacetylase (PgdA/CDA1 family)
MPPVAVTIDTEHAEFPTANALGTLDRLLEVLHAHGVKATFFVVGHWASAYPKRLEAIRDAAHEIGNHSYSHCPLTRLTEHGIVEDLLACHAVLAKLGVETRPWFRAPQGALAHPNIDVHGAISRAGYRHVPWHGSGDDWKPGNTPEQIARATVDGVLRRWPEPAILNCHSWPAPTPAALELVLTQLTARGAEFRTVGELGWAPS